MPASAEGGDRSDEAINTISSAMPVSTIITILTKYQCREITDQLDLNKCKRSPSERGGFGDIYYGALKCGEKVAIKCARLYLQEDDETGRKALKRAARELYYWSRFEHKNVLGLLGLAQFQDQLAMISPWMDKGTLLQYIKKNPTADRHQLCVDISEGVAYLHQSGAIHGDIKSANVLVSSEGVAKLTDFGCTELKTGTLCFTTTSGNSNFTMRWAAPEILNGLQTRSKEGDVYALGMTLIEAITGVKPFGDLGDMAVWRAVMVEKLIPERPKIFPSFTLDEAEELWEVVVHACAHGAPDRPDSRTIQRRLQNIRRRVIHPSFNLSGVDPTPHVVVNSLAGGNGERGEKNEVHPPIIDETKNQLCHIDRLPDCGEYDDQQQPHAQSVLPPLSPSQTYDVQTDPRASTPRHQSTSVVLANSSWAPHQPWPAPQQAPYYTPEAYIGRHASTEPHPQLQTPPLLPPSRWDNYQPSPPQSDEESRPCSPELLSERRSAPEPGQAGSFAAHWPGPPYIPDPIGVMVDSRFDRSDVQITYTGDYAVKLGRHVLRHCFNCHATEPSGWRESTLTPGKIVCNKCGLYERSHARPRPLHIDNSLRGPALFPVKLA